MRQHAVPVFRDPHNVISVVVNRVPTSRVLLQGPVKLKFFHLEGGGLNHLRDYKYCYISSHYNCSLAPPTLMHLDISTLQRNGRTYQRVLLRESYRQNGKVKKRTLANLSACSPGEIEAIQLALLHKHNLAQLGSVEQDLTVQQGPSVGAEWLVWDSEMNILRGRGFNNDIPFPD